MSINCFCAFLWHNLRARSSWNCCRFWWSWFVLQFRTNLFEIAPLQNSFRSGPQENWQLENWRFSLLWKLCFFLPVSTRCSAMSSSIGWRANFWTKSSTGLTELLELQVVAWARHTEVSWFLRFNVLVKPDLFCSFCEKLLAEQALWESPNFCHPENQARLEAFFHLFHSVRSIKKSLAVWSNLSAPHDLYVEMSWKGPDSGPTVL